MNNSSNIYFLNFVLAFLALGKRPGTLDSSQRPHLLSIIKDQYFVYTINLLTFSYYIFLSLCIKLVLYCFPIRSVNHKYISYITCTLLHIDHTIHVCMVIKDNNQKQNVRKISLFIFSFYSYLACTEMEKRKN